MKTTIAVISVQLLFWSGFVLAMKLADHDPLKYRVVLMLVVFYICYFIALQFVKGRVRALWLTIMSFLLFFSGRAVYLWIVFYL